MTTKTDLIKGTRRTLNHQDKRGDSATNAVHVDGVTADAAGLDTALSDAVAATGSTYSQDSTLEVQSATVAKYKNTAVLGSVHFGRGITSKPTQQAWKLATQTIGTYPLRYHLDPMLVDGNGRPTGTFKYEYSTSGGVPKLLGVSTYSWPMGIQRISMRTVLTSDPTDSLTPYVQMVNSVPVSLAACCNPAGTGTTGVKVYGAYELWFYGFVATPIDTASGVKWLVYYNLMAMPAPGWVQQVAVPVSGFASNRPIVGAHYYLGGSSVPEAAVFDYVFPNKIGDLTGKLPVHTP